jgi:hypothetical protein
MEETICTSPLFWIFSLKRFTSSNQTFKLDDKKTLFTEPRTLHAPERSVVKQDFLRLAPPHLPSSSEPAALPGTAGAAQSSKSI